MYYFQNLKEAERSCHRRDEGIREVVSPLQSLSCLRSSRRMKGPKTDTEGSCNLNMKSRSDR